MGRWKCGVLLEAWWTDLGVKFRELCIAVGQVTQGARPADDHMVRGEEGSGW